MYKNGYQIFKPVETIIRGDQGRNRTNRGDEPNCVLMHTYMKMPQAFLLYSYLKQAKMSLFFLSKNWRTEGQKRPSLRGWYQWEGEEWRKGVRS
jgi:hypothetical protein